MMNLKISKGVQRGCEMVHWTNFVTKILGCILKPKDLVKFRNDRCGDMCLNYTKILWISEFLNL